MNTLEKQSFEWARLNVEPEYAAAAVVRAVTRGEEMADEFFMSADAGVEATSQEIDLATLGVVVAQVRTAAKTEVQAQAKRLALQMLRDLAANQQTGATCPR